MTPDLLKLENERLCLRLEEAEETIRAIRSGQVDAFVVSHAEGEKVFTLETADRPYRLFVESMQLGAVTLADDGTILFCNAYFANLLRTPAEQLTGAALRELILEQYRAEYDEAIATGRGEVVLRSADAFSIPVDLSIHPLPANAQTAMKCVLVTDLTEQKYYEALNRSQEALRESAERFSTLADNISQFAWMADANGWIYWYNQRWYDYTGTTLEEMQGWGWKKVHHPDHVDRVVKRIQQSWDTGEAWEDTFPLRGKDGQYRWFLSRALPIHDEEGRVVRWFGTNTDITEQRQMADELRQNAADLSDADRRKNEFLAMLAHELRNPLAPIRNTVRILRLTGGNDAVQSASEMMERQVDQMVRLVDDLVEVSRITRGKIELRKTRVELGSIVRHAVEVAHALIQCMGHDLAVTLPAQTVYVEADSARLAQILGNLLSNACKFTEKGGRISLTVEVGAASRAASGEAAEEVPLRLRRAQSARSRDLLEVEIRVRDTGIGIAKDELPRIFDMFKQVDTSLERTASGLGIGLTLVKNLVELHGGTVTVNSAGIGKGSEFIVRLPIAVEAPAAPPDSVKIGPTSVTPHHILVVDDNHDSAKSLAMLLKLTGHETHIAHDGLEAVEAAEKLRPDVVLLDIGLPKMNGYEVARRLRQHTWGKDMLLVALTGWGQDEDRQKSRQAGFDTHFVKPVDFTALQKLLAERSGAGIVD